MKTIHYVGLMLLCSLMLQACTDREENKTVEPQIAITRQGTFTDAKDGSVYKWVRIGNTDWMTRNYTGGTPWFEQQYESNGFLQSFQTDNPAKEQAYIAENGNYYTFQQAVELCPEGWRIPTDDDWKSLETAVGMSPRELDTEGWRQGAGQYLANGLLLFPYAGQLVSYFTSMIEPYHRGDYGYYWTSTRVPDVANTVVYIRKIGSGLNAVSRTKVDVAGRYLPVRYVRTAPRE